MTTADKMGFTECKSLNRLHTRSPDGVIPDRTAPQDGDDVSLTLNGETLNVVNIKIFENGVYEGEIKSFRYSCGVEFNGLKLDDPITFMRRHIMTLSLR